MTPNTALRAWRESNVVKVTDYSYESINRALKVRLRRPHPENPMNEIGFSGCNRWFPDDLLLGDIIVIGMKIGNGVEVGEIQKIEKSVDNIVITVEEASEDLWQEDFIKMIRKSGQGLFVFGIPNPARSLCVDLSLANPKPIPMIAPLPPPPPPVHNNYNEADGNGDGTITEQEANDFASESRRVIAEAGLTFAELAGKIPPMLKVRNIEVAGIGLGGCTTHFNGVPAKVSLVGGTSFVYIPAKTLPGVRINTYGDVDRIRLEELADGQIRQARGIGVPNAPLPPPWPTPNRYMSVIDKKGESVVVNGEKIASIRKVKKCGKCYYKIEIEDSGFVPSIKTGYLKECLLTIREGGKPSMHA
jgi:hypothetical protein